MEAGREHEEQEDFPELTSDDVDEMIETEEADVDAPMDEDDSGDEDQDASNGQGGEQFEDTSIAAFYDHRDSVFVISLHPSYPAVPIAFTGGADDRGRLWDTRTGESLVELTGHEDSVVAGGFSASGEYVATGGLDGKVRIWRLHPPPGGKNNIAAFAPRPHEDAVRNGPDWGRCEFVTSIEGPDEVNWLAWHPKGNVLAAGAADSSVWMWNIPTGNVMGVFSGHTGPVTCGKFTPDGKRLITASEDGTLLIWDPRSTTALSKLQPGDARFNMESGITSMCISQDNKIVVVGGSAGAIRVVNLSNIEDGGAALVVGVLKGHADGESIEGLEFVDLLGSVNGSTAQATGRGNPAATNNLISVSTDGKAIVWDLPSSKVRCEGVHDEAITTLALHGTGPLFSTASADQTIKTWDARSGACLATHKGFTNAVLGVTIGVDDGYTQGTDTGGVGAYSNLEGTKGWKVIGAGDEGVALVFRV
jgi:ribosome assembly protein SQT1